MTSNDVEKFGSSRYTSFIKILHNLRTEYFPIVDELFEKLKVEPKMLVQELHISDNSIRRVLKKLSEENQYISRQGSDRKTSYIFSKLLDIVE